jgi:hypothetical protein
MRPLRIAALALLLSASAAEAGTEPEPERIGGRDQIWWSQQARAHERHVEELERALEGCEEREAPPAYQDVPVQVFRDREGRLRTREVLRCDDLRVDLEGAELARDAFEDLARRLGVPPGWLR